MKLKNNLLSLFVFLISCQQLNAQTGNSDTTLYASELIAYGRYAFDVQQNLELISSGVHFGFSFSGKKCAVFVFIADTSGHNYLQYELDGVYQKQRIKVDGGRINKLTIAATNGERHMIWIYKATEAHTGPIFVKKITGINLHPLSPIDEPLIEFIGNSITCGAASDTSDVKCGAGVYHDQHNAYQSYGPRVARALHANFILNSVSGIGVYRTWNMDGPSMPQVYEKIDFQLNGNVMWDFRTYSPKIVSIALGTNDLSHGDHVNPRAPFDSAVFVNGYIAFVQLVKSKYPNTKMVLLSSAMVHGSDRETLQNCLWVVKKNIDALYPSDDPVSLFFFAPMNAGGCSGHPSVEDHAALADQLIPFFKKLLLKRNSHQ